MLSFLRSNSPFYFIVISWSALIFGIVNHYINDHNYNFFWPFLAYFSINKFLVYCIYVFVVFFTAFKINFIINKSVFFQRTNYACGLIYTITIILMCPIHQAVLPAIANLFAVLAIENLMKIYRNKSCKIEVFNAACWLLLSSIAYVYNAFLIPMVWVVLYFIRPFEWREYVMPIVGFLFIAVYFITAGLVFGKLPFWIENWWAIKDGYLNNDFENWIYFLIVISIGLLISFRTLYLSYISSSNRYKKVSWIIIALLFCCVVQFLFNYFSFGLNSPVLYGAVFPFSILISSTILNAKSNWLPNSFIGISVIGYIIITYII